MNVLVTAVALVSLIAQPVAVNSAIETDRRPMAAGVYDASVSKTFFSWMGRNSDSYVQSYDHSSGVWSAPKKVGTSAGDSHNYPVMVQASDGRLLVFHGAHNAPLKLATAPTAHSIDGTWTDVVLSTTAAASSYPMPVKALTAISTSSTARLCAPSTEPHRPIPARCGSSCPQTTDAPGRVRPAQRSSGRQPGPTT